MNKLNNVFFILLLLQFFLFSGCITIEVSQVLNENMSSDVEIKYDLSAMIQGLDNMDESLNDNDSIEVEQTAEMPDCYDVANVTEATGFKCSSPRDGVIILSGKWENQDEYFKIEKSLTKTVYEYDATEVFEILEFLSQDEEDKLDKAGISELKMINPSLEYNVRFPTKVESAEVGLIQDDVVEMDIFDLLDVESAKIVAVERNFTLYYIIGGVLLLLLVGGLYVFIKNKENGNSQIQNNNQVLNQNNVNLQQQQSYNNNNNNNMNGRF